MSKFKVGDKVKVVRKTNSNTNHANRQIGEIFIIKRIKSDVGNYYREKYQVDNYIDGTDNRGAISNRDLELVKITNWKQVMQDEQKRK